MRRLPRLVLLASATLTLFLSFRAPSPTLGQTPPANRSFLPVVGKQGQVTAGSDRFAPDSSTVPTVRPTSTPTPTYTLAPPVERYDVADTVTATPSSTATLVALPAGTQTPVAMATASPRA